MDISKIFESFFLAIENDGRISAAHIGVYAALVQYRVNNGSSNPIQVFSYQIMNLAKISAPATYRKCMKDLSDAGYIKFVPSYKRNQGSKVFF